MTNAAPFSSGRAARGAPPTASHAGPSLSTVPRRSSYASVVSGTALSPPQQHHNHHNHHQLGQAANSLSYSSLLRLNGHLPASSFGVDLPDTQMTNSAAVERWPLASSNNSTAATLPPYSRKYASFFRQDDFFQSYGGAALDGSGFGSGSAAAGVSLLTPSYLRNSQYICRLDAARRAKAAALREASASATASVGPSSSLSLSTSSSHANLHRIAPSHRGMTYDLIEKKPAGDDELLGPLPSRWNELDKYEGLELSNSGLEVRYLGQPNKHELEAAAVRADYPMPPQCGIYYFEIKILSKPKEG